ncbi:ABC-2 transporter permease [Tepidimicrobium xylanilyticum]|uniref:ABC-2 family transporter protein n=1 Tax=Tepidimicrobium xylanilyticum TaxID=1123352 RepID=A0A1H2X9W0_9FIRM|nr:ABC-2 transporter permease [Tepidimicrobium xylanilyticum]SDW89640.1 ABC-2 family transporter protein [Tepidimicrobium xylanilyticum]
MLAILKKDLILLFSNKREILFMIFYIPFLVFTVESYDPKILYFTIIIFFTYFMSLSSFYHDVDGKGKYILNSLPITGKRIVVYKYISIFAYFIISIVFVGGYLWIINTIGLATVDYFNIEMIFKAIPIVMLIISTVFPAYIFFEPRIARIVNMLVSVVFIVGLMNLGYVGEKSLVKMVGILEGNSPVYLCIIAYVVSLILSMVLYQKKDL